MSPPVGILRADWTWVRGTGDSPALGWRAVEVARPRVVLTNLRSAVMPWLLPDVCLKHPLAAS